VKRKHRDLIVWQEGIELVQFVYQITSSFPSQEQFGLTIQLRRAAVSVPANIAEGCARSGTKELLRFLSIPQGSLSELDTLVELSSRLGYLKDTASARLKIDKVSGLTMGLVASLKRRQAQATS
jgi:four helix bundle protein